MVKRVSHLSHLRVHSIYRYVREKKSIGVILGYPQLKLHHNYLTDMPPEDVQQTHSLLRLLLQACLGSRSTHHRTHTG